MCLLVVHVQLIKIVIKKNPSCTQLGKVSQVQNRMNGEAEDYG